MAPLESAVVVVEGTIPECPLQASRSVGAEPVVSYCPYSPRPSRAIPIRAECPKAVRIISDDTEIRIVHEILPGQKSTAHQVLY